MLSGPWKRIFSFSWWKVAVWLTVTVVFYFELGTYVVAFNQWPKIIGVKESDTRILFIADPQILGEEYESWIARWDADRYLTKTFYMAVKYVRPSCIVFLGDLMDEGSISTRSQYNRYLERFRRIFVWNDSSTNSMIFIPGDNDIGGENEIIHADKVKAFRDHFSNKDIIDVEHLKFIKINNILKTVPSIHDPGDNRTVRIIISHIPLLSHETYFASKAISEIQPHVIFSAHDHTSVHFVGDHESEFRNSVELLDVNKGSKGLISSWRFQLRSNLINEIVVPTCSYRMGVEKMGYGVGLFDKNGEVLSYHVLWLPRRLEHLITYLGLIFGFSTLFLFWITFKTCCRRGCRCCLFSGLWKVLTERN